MSVSTKLWTTAVAAVLFGVFGVAGAQPEEGTGVTEVLATRDTNLSAEQMKKEAATYLPMMEQGAGTVGRQLEEARAARDVVKVLCLNDKLTQLDVAIRSARDRYSAFMVAAERGDLERARHEFTVLQVLRDRARELVAEANQCIGEETGFIGESRVTWDIEPTVPDTDPSVYPEDPLITTPPTVSSPTQ